MKHEWSSFSLNGEWEMYFAKSENVINSYTCFEELETSGFEKIKATVPGNFELDMFAAGLIDQPYKTRCDIVGDVRLKLEGDCDDSHFEEEFDLVFPYGRKKLVFKNPLLWWPRNFGKQNRYYWKITLTRDGEIIEQKCFKQGIAHIRLDYIQ